MIEHDISIDASGGKLSGTLCLPDDQEAHPVVLMVHGTGPLDRDENMDGQRLDIFNTIAHFIADHGMASLRYDKRGCARSAGDYYRAGHFDLVSDAVSWFDALVQSRFCDPTRIYMLGHSEGGIIVPQLSIARPTVAGLILLCPFVDRFESILMKQAARIELESRSASGILGMFRSVWWRLMGMSVANQKKLIRRVMFSEEDTFKIGGQRIPAKSLRELMQLEPRVIFAGVTCPVLLVGGSKDLQCDPADVHRIAGLAKGVVEARVIPDLTHVLRKTELPPSILGGSELLRKPMDSDVLDILVSWLTRSSANDPLSAAGKGGRECPVAKHQV